MQSPAASFRKIIIDGVKKTSFLAIEFENFIQPMTSLAKNLTKPLLINDVYAVQIILMTGRNARFNRPPLFELCACSDRIAPYNGAQNFRFEVGTTLMSGKNSRI